MTANPDTIREDLPNLARFVADRVCRTTFDAPGYCLIDLGSSASSVTLRSLIVALKRHLETIHHTHTGRSLDFLSAGRFDQQVTTKLHRDGGPEESLLLLGYEPTPIASELFMADFSRCAHDLGLDPSAFLERHNPMFSAGADLLRPYTRSVSGFSNRSYQLVVINNSLMPYVPEAGTWQGVLHGATVRDPSEAHRRVVNSTMVASVPPGTGNALSEEAIAEFLTTSAVRRRGYDNPRLEDDV